MTTGSGFGLFCSGTIVRHQTTLYPDCAGPSSSIPNAKAVLLHLQFARPPLPSQDLQNAIFILRRILHAYSVTLTGRLGNYHLPGLLASRCDLTLEWNGSHDGESSHCRLLLSVSTPHTTMLDLVKSRASRDSKLTGVVAGERVVSQLNIKGPQESTDHDVQRCIGHMFPWTFTPSDAKSIVCARVRRSG